jgi:DNA-binding NarL/FixJ family response regulator
MATMDNPPVEGLLLSDDMIFTSRVVGTGKDLDHPIRAARSAEGLLALAREYPPRCVILDLSNPGLNIVEFLPRLAALCSPMPLVVAYGSHVDTATLRQARDAGCNLVWPRSKFVEELPQALPGWFSPPGTTS